MKKAILPLILLTSLSAYPQKQSCKCRPPQPPPSYDDNSDKEYIYKRMYGQVSSLGSKPEPIENMTIEVYDHPDPAGSSSNISRATQRLIAFCKTDKNGMFCFSGIPPGKYEIRISDREYRKAGPWADVTLLVTLDPRKRRSTNRLIKTFLQFRI